MRIGLVLGGGGVVGGSWLVGALEALESETGWSPANAEIIAGTSAGSVVGALTATGISPSLMAAYIGGGSIDEIAETEGRTQELEERLLGHRSGRSARDSVSSFSTNANVCARVARSRGSTLLSVTIGTPPNRSIST